MCFANFVEIKPTFRVEKMPLVPDKHVTRL